MAFLGREDGTRCHRVPMAEDGVVKVTMVQVDGAPRRSYATAIKEGASSIFQPPSDSRIMQDQMEKRRDFLNRLRDDQLSHLDVITSLACFHV